ncbi:hypothetical protein [Cohaesibacter gelatinilyticus]|uniref:Uncharacterized protein n=1 Tax=Cohaesibacter gelatinilyticus TaxID=372072 RepID=A0A285PGS1_9HYPH|nr:hypothetical protein [Cohaesibacter gelatinilyticus]SNZ20909.1 hypothetical protein SAMN06265368_4022 [Cohaesibacter gelatinilyticus]
MMMFANYNADTGEVYAICGELHGLPDKENFVQVDADMTVGWRIIDGAAVSPPESALEPLKPVTRKQLIDALIDHDLDEQVEPALNVIPDVKAKKKALNAWQNASQYEPDHPLVLRLKGVLNLSNDQFDALWREAMAA